MHPEIPVIRGLTHIEFYSDPESPSANCRNAVVVPPGGIDRSPCGTGTSAKAAVLYAKGELKKGQEFLHESIVGSVFRAKVVEETTVGSLPAVIPEISGSAWITGFHQFVMQDQDQLNKGFFML
ncbi:Proline racemase [compost metagenome]